MQVKLAHLLFWAFFLGSLVIGGAIFYEKNQDGVTYFRTCVQSDGKPYDPRIGEGPECEEYGNTAEAEGKPRAVLRGVGQALMPGLLLGFLGLYIGDKLDDRKESENKQKQD